MAAAGGAAPCNSTSGKATLDKPLIANSTRMELDRHLGKLGRVELVL